jgi:hypothetical protein
MSPRHATRTSYRPKEGRRFTSAIKVSLHVGEMERVAIAAAEDNVTPAEWVRNAVRERLEAIFDTGLNGWGAP